MADNETTIVDFAAMAEAISGYKNKVNSITDIMSALQAISKALQVANIFTGGAATAFIQSIDSTVQALTFTNIRTAGCDHGKSF